MIVALVQFRLPQPVSVAQAREIYASTAPRYLNVPGLLGKNYILSEDGGTVGGLYYWESRAAAESMYSGEWRSFVTDKYGAAPVVTFYESPVQVDVDRQQVTTR